MNDLQKVEILKNMINQYPTVTYDKFITFFAVELEFDTLPFVDQPKGLIALRSYGRYLELMSEENIWHRLFNWFMIFTKTALISALKNPGAAAMILSLFHQVTKKLDKANKMQLIKIIKEGEEKRLADEKTAMKNKYLPA